ncbi:MAG TPA: SGNH/GDSL hydrolase family protein [Pelobium sp.]|nr:SGNH/GDSL hydrolase family protein [Pelobium sp.]
MKKYTNIKLLLAGLVLVASACKTEIDVPAVSTGGADFTKYIAIGNSLTSGYADNGLYLAGQLNSYPNIIAQQMKVAGGGDFKQPLFTEAQSNGSGYLKLDGFNADGTPKLVPVTDKLAYRNAQKQFTKYTDEINNLGIPGMRLDLAVTPLANSFSAQNPYFERLLPDAEVGTKTYLQFISGRNHTFFTCWLGNNDVLGWATNGGVVAGDPTKALTSKADFTMAYNGLIATMTAQGQKGAVANIPDVTAIPYFNTVTVAAINAGLKANPQTADYSLIINALNPATGLHSPRPATNEDLIILTFNTAGIGVNGYGLSPLNPIANNQVLDKAEVAKAQDHVSSYNATIKAIADAKGLAFFDAYTFLNTFKDEGAVIDGVAFTADFIRGNAFSLDGVHLTQKGYAVVANEFIKSINAKYGSNLSTVSLSNYPAVVFP